MANITRQDLALVLVEKLGCTATLAKAMVDGFFQVMVDAIASGNKIEIRGFGSWTVRQQNAQPNARNPMTGEQVSVPAMQKAAFKPGKAIREALSTPHRQDRTAEASPSSNERE